MIKIEDDIMAHDLGRLHAGGYVKGSAKKLGVPSHLMKDFEAGKTQRPKASKDFLHFLAIRYRVINEDEAPASTDFKIVQR